MLQHNGKAEGAQLIAAPVLRTGEPALLDHELYI
jgi:hypothetical protein